MRFIALCAVSCLLGTAGGAGIVRGQTPAPAPTPASVAKAEQVLLEARKALGADKLAAVKNMIASGRTRRIRGNNLVPIEFEIFSNCPTSTSGSTSSPPRTRTRHRPASTATP